MKEHYSKYDAFVLSGGSKYSLLENEEIYSEVISLIEKSIKPILGISLGFEIIGYTYDEMLEKAVGFGSGIRQIKIKDKEDPIFEGVNSDFVAAEAHKWFFSGLKNLKILATSQRGVEIAKHSEKNIYGIQFHPEIDIGDVNSKKIIENFVRLI
jgi:anthranilate/para-aminobenzoate synthase component II